MDLKFCLRIAGLSVLLIAVTGASPTDDSLEDFFPIMGSGLNLITTAVHSLTAFQTALAEPTMMISMDIILDNRTKIPVMAQIPDQNPLVLDSVLNQTAQYDTKGLKLNFDDLEAVEPAMVVIKKHGSNLMGPLWLNAHIVNGPNSQLVSPPVEPNEFINITNSYFNKTTLSLGFTSHWNRTSDEKMYSWSMIFDILYYSYPLDPQRVNFQIRAVWCYKSWPKLLWLLGLRESFSITVWSLPTDGIDYAGLEILHFRGIGDIGRIYYDLSPSQKRALDETLTLAELGSLQPLNTSWDRDQWVGFENQKGRNFAFLSSEGLGISGNATRTAIVHSKLQHMPEMNGAMPMVLRGRVQFVGRNENQNATSLEIFIRSRSLLDDDEARADILAGNSDPSGLKFSLFSDGRMITDTCEFNGAPSMGCYDVEIEDSLDGSYVIRRTVKTCSDAPVTDPLDGSEDSCGVTAENPPDCRQEFYVTVIGGQGGIILEGLTVEGSQRPNVDCPTTTDANEMTTPEADTQDPTLTTPVSKGNSVLISCGLSSLLMISMTAAILVSSVHPFSF